MLIDLFLVVGIAWAAGAAVDKLGYPPVLGELAAGVLVGPPVLGWIEPSDGLSVLATVGIILLMLLAGLRATPADVARNAPTALLPALAGLALPMALGYGIVVGVEGGTPEAGLMVGVILGVTALATVSRILIDLDLLSTPIGQRLMCVSLLEVILVLLAFAVVNGAVGGGGEPLAIVGLKAVAFLAGAVVVGQWVLTPLGQMLDRIGLLGHPGGFTFALTVGVGFAAASQAAGLTFVPGAFLAGLFLSPEALGRYHDATRDTIRDAGLGFLTPVFFFTAGFAADLTVLAREPLLVGAVVATGVLGKIGAGIVGLWPTKASWREGAVLGAGMNGRGGIDVILAGAALTGGLITSDLFTALVITTFAATLPVPVLLQKGIRWASVEETAAPEA
ncbi:MAG: cation:proton antiporter [Bacteroidota bacterium]